MSGEGIELIGTICCHSHLNRIPNCHFKPCLGVTYQRRQMWSPGGRVQRYQPSRFPDVWCSGSVDHGIMSGAIRKPK